MVRLIRRSVCPKKMVKNFWDVHFSFVMVKSRVFDSKMNGFSANLFAVLVYYLEVEDVDIWVVVGNAVFRNCTSDMTVVFFYSIFHLSAGFSCVRKVAIFFWAGPFVGYVLF